MAKIEFLDTTLRDGAQAVGISFSKQDKQKVFSLLCDFGIDCIEGGDPASNPKDCEFFATATSDKLVAFGSTAHPSTNVQEDSAIKKLIEANTRVVSIVGKASKKQVEKVLKIAPSQNLTLIHDTISYLVESGKRVIFDAEHFFDGYKSCADYALAVLQTARDAGANTLVLCDTNGGSMPSEIALVVSDVVSKFGDCAIGIHAHNDAGMAVANSIVAVEAGATHVQGTFLGFGERCGNANLSSVIANVALKQYHQVGARLEWLTKTAVAIAEICNIKLDDSMPYVGMSAFSHKAGMHADAVLKDETSFEHVSPALVGNSSSIVLSEFSGRSAVVKKLERMFPSLTKHNPKTQEILDAIKLMEMKGYQFEGADGSLGLLAEKIMTDFKPSFELVSYSVISQNSAESTAEVCIKVGSIKTVAKGSGNGPVNALDSALRDALKCHYPEISNVSLVDYKVRVVDSTSATGAIVRVLITSTDKQNTWTTVGVSTDIIEASWFALVDSLECKLTGQGKLGIFE